MCKETTPKQLRLIRLCAAECNESSKCYARGASLVRVSCLADTTELERSSTETLSCDRGRNAISQWLCTLAVS